MALINETEMSETDGGIIRAQTGRALAGWEIASVASSFLIAGWMVLPFVGNSKLIAAIPVGLAFGLMFLSHRARGESLRDIGWRADNFLRAARLLIIPMMIAAIVVLSVGWFNHSLRFGPSGLRLRFLFLPLWTLAQQYVLQGFVNRRAQILLGEGKWSVLLVACFFALLHLPNLWLSVATFVGGMIWAAVYQRAPNLWALALSHAMMSLLLALSLPVSVINGLRVGFKYFGID